jgi:hypothetical protein
MIPFCIAISIMGTRELWLNVMLPWQKRRRLSELNEAYPAPAAVPEPVKSRPLPRVVKKRQSRG